MKARQIALLVIGSLLLTAVPSMATVPAIVPLEDPEFVVAEATDYVIQAPKIYYVNDPGCSPIRGDRSKVAATTTQYIGRTAVQGATPRHLFEFTYDEFCTSPPPDIYSNIASDSGHVYWLSRTQGGLVRLSGSAILGDEPELVSAQEVKRSEILQIGDDIYLLNTGWTGNTLVRIDKTTGATTPLLSGAAVGDQTNNFQTDDVYLYWRFREDATWKLKRYRLSSGVHDTIAENVFGYYPVAGNAVYIGFEDVIRRYDHATGSLSDPIYTSPVDALITGIAADASSIYFIQQQQCTPPCPGAYSLNRVPITGGSATPLYILPLDPVQTLHHLKQHSNLLFFLRERELMRISTNADTAVLTNMQITGIEITQSIQDNNNSVPLIRGKRTAVRLFVQSGGEDIPGVHALLYRIDGSGSTIAGPLSPTNVASDSAYLRVRAMPNIKNINHSFLFFLPPDWTDDATLRLRAELNPFRFPPEPDYGDNILTTATFDLQTSPRLETHFVLFEYESGGSRFRPRYREDLQLVYSWIRRAYPLASAPGGPTDPSPGFRPSFRYLFDPNLGGNVDGTDRDPHCECRLASPSLDEATCRTILGDGFDVQYREGIDPDLCAAYYVTGPALDTIRAAEDIPSSVLLYGMVADDAGFPRGTSNGKKWVVGPSGPVPGRLPAAWDIDGTYADWYAAHEIGHGLDRKHPNAGSDDPTTPGVFELCGHSRSDPSFPYGNTSTARAPIGDSTIRGFDVGMARVYASDTWNDVMSYCGTYWISDYTYEGILSSFATRAQSPEATPAAEQYLQLSGILMRDADSAYLTQVRVWDSITESPPLPQPGNYRIRLLSGGIELAGYDFTPQEGEDSDDSNNLYISELVPFVDGSQRVEIIRNSPQESLWTFDISTNEPMVSNVDVVNPILPLTGEITLQWTGSDADGDDLTYDVLYSADGGATWQLLVISHDAPSASIDTAGLAGSTDARFKVIANDGLNQGEGVSDPLSVVNKAPTITILSPADNTQASYGQVLYFAADVYDLQDETIPSGQIEWRNQNGDLLGTGPEFATDDFLIGSNDITVTAANSLGQTSSETVRVVVEDELNLPGPTLAVWPDLVSWHVSDDETALQVAEIAVDNVGDGVLGITVNEDAPWLTITTFGSQTPMTTTVSADPAQLSSGESTSGILQIIGTVDLETQTLSIPVSLAKGNTWLPKDQRYKVYLPLVSR